MAAEEVWRAIRKRMYVKLSALQQFGYTQRRLGRRWVLCCLGEKTHDNTAKSIDKDVNDVAQAAAGMPGAGG